jgi:RNA polymerase-binding transcription factor DksA
MVFGQEYDMLTENQIYDFKKTLDDRLLELREDVRLELLQTEDQSYIELAGKVHDIGEASVADLLVDLQLADIDRHINEIRDIDAAFLRIAARNYGVCTDCQVSIDVNRLQAYPTAKRCHRCQVNHEHHYAEVRPSTL